LDEIDLLRGKLSQLEHSVLSAAASGPAGSGGAAAAAGNKAAAGATGGGGGVDMRTLLQSLGLGEEVAAALTAVGVGPAGPGAASDNAEELQEQQQGDAWHIGALPAAGRSMR
jgi:hypothetical protein